MNHALPDANDARLAQYPDYARRALLEIRSVFYAVADGESQIGAIEESLKWNQLAFRPKKTGTTLRIGWSEKLPNVVSIFVPCSTTIVEEFRTSHPEFDSYGDREFRFVIDEIDDDAVRTIAQRAFTYFQS